MNKKIILGSLVLASVLFTSGCMEEKKIPADQLITIYDSNLRETNKLAPLETMYVKIAGLAPNELHKIEILDPNLNLISQAEVFSGDNGVIEPLPIWYDVGLEKQADGNYTITKQDLSIKSFYVRVTSLENKGTDFKQDFYLLLKKPTDANDMPKSIVTSVSIEDGNIANAQIENTFLETGSKTPDGSDSNLTKVYVKADQLPYKTLKDGEMVDAKQVDIYVVPFAGGAFEDGMDLESIAVTSRKDVPTIDNTTYRTLEPTLIWDLNKAPQLKNPGDSNNAYSIIIDTNQNGKFDIGEDLDGDGKYDKYIDGVDGQSVAGFIIMNTEANDLDYSISDGENNLNTISETESGDQTELYLNVNNIPTTQENATIYVINKDTTELEDGTDLVSNDVRNDNSDGSKGTSATINKPDNENTFMPYIENAKFLNTIANSAGYGYNEDISKETPLDVVVDINNNGVFDKGTDYYFPNAVTILPFDATVTTSVNSDGSEVTSIFNEANSENNTTVYVKYGSDNSGTCSTQRYAYLYPASQTPTDGDELFDEILRNQVYTDNNCVTKYIDSTELYQNETLKIINPTDKNNKYVIVIDKNDDHKYNSADGDKLVYITFKDTDANGLPNVSYINLASGGLMGQPYQHWVDTPYANAYDYRDTFTVNAEDTVPTEWWWASYWMTKGIKVVWNPYMKNKGWWGRKTETYIDEQGNTQPTMLMRRQVVDLYIIDADKYKLSMDMELNDTMDVKGRHLTLPIQFSCRNGAYLQTIWKAPLKVGKYYVIVDVNRNGKVDNGIDLIDATTKTGITIKDDPSVVGFSVTE